MFLFFSMNFSRSLEDFPFDEELQGRNGHKSASGFLQMELRLINVATVILKDFRVYVLLSNPLLCLYFISILFLIFSLFVD